MKRRIITPLLACVLCAQPVCAKVNITTIAAASTIAVNVISIRETVSKVRKAAKAAGRGVKKAAKKVAGKK